MIFSHEILYEGTLFAYILLEPLGAGKKRPLSGLGQESEMKIFWVRPLLLPVHIFELDKSVLIRFYYFIVHSLCNAWHNF